MRSLSRSLDHSIFRALPCRATVVLFQPPPLYPPLVDVAEHCSHVFVVDHDAVFEPGIVRQQVVVAAEHQVRACAVTVSDYENHCTTGIVVVGTALVFEV